MRNNSAKVILSLIQFQNAQPRFDARKKWIQRSEMKWNEIYNNLSHIHSPLGYSALRTVSDVSLKVEIMGHIHSPDKLSRYKQSEIGIL